MPERRRLKAVLIGASAGGVEALGWLLGALPGDFPLPLIVVQHVSPSADGGLAELLDQRCALRVKEADDGELPVGGTAYLAPANYHLLVEPDGRLALSVDPPVGFARPSVDVLFESAAEAFGPGAVGVVLTGGGADGSRGLKRIRERGGVGVAQDPRDAQAPSMPEHAVHYAEPDHVVALALIPGLLLDLMKR